MSGKIFFGQPSNDLTQAKSGFMYDPSTQSIRSANDNIVINSNGSISAASAIISSGLFSGKLACNRLYTEKRNSGVYDVALPVSDSSSYQSIGYAQVKSIANAIGYSIAYDVKGILDDAGDPTYFYKSEVFRIVLYTVNGNSLTELKALDAYLIHSVYYMHRPYHDIVEIDLYDPETGEPFDLTSIGLSLQFTEETGWRDLVYSPNKIAYELLHFESGVYIDLGAQIYLTSTDNLRMDIYLEDNILYGLFPNLNDVPKTKNLIYKDANGFLRVSSS